MHFNERDVNAPKETLKRCGRCVEWKEWWFTYDKSIFIFTSNQYPWISVFVLAKLNKISLIFFWLLYLPYQCNDRSIGWYMGEESSNVG
jgi:hypothetical protein